MEIQVIESKSKSKTDYSHSITETVELSQPVPANFLKEILTCPRYYELLSYKLMLCYKRDGVSPFQEKESLKEGDEMLGWLQFIEKPEEKNIYKVTKLELTPNKSSIMLETRKLNSETPDAELTLSYTHDALSNKPPILGITLHINPPHPAFLTILRTMYQQVGHRMKNLVSNYNTCLKEFIIAGAVEIEKTDKANFYGNPYAIGATLTISQNVDELFESLRCHDFINKILHSSNESEQSEKKKTEEKLTLKAGDTFLITLKNIKFTVLPMQLESIEEKVTFTVKKCENGVIELLSNDGIHNFHQFGISFELESVNSSTATIKINLHYNLDTKLSLINKGLTTANKVTEFFKVSLPDVKQMLFMRMRSMLDATTRHLCRYLTEELKDVEIKPVSGKTIENTN